MNEHPVIKMTVEELLKEMLVEQKQTNWLLEKLLQKKGLLSRENERKIKEALIKEGKLTKQEVCNLLGVSNNSATNIMKRLYSDSIAFIPGLGRRSSLLVYVDNPDSLESKAIKLERIIPRGSSFTREEIKDKLQLNNQQEVMDVVTLLREFFGKDFFWENGMLKRRK